MGLNWDALQPASRPPQGESGHVGDPTSRASRRKSRKQPRGRVIVAQGLVLTLAVTGISGFALSHRSVTLDVNGERTAVRGYAANVGQLLRDKGIEISAHDQVSPALTAAVPAGGTISVKTARPVTISVDGEDKTVWTTASTVDQVLGELGVRDEEVATSASRSSRLGSQLRVATAKNVEVVVEGKVVQGETAAENVADALSDLGVNLSDSDRTSVPLDSPVADGMAIVVDQPEYVTVTRTTTLKHDTVEEKDSTAPVGTKKVTQQGKNGKQQVTYRITKLGGVEVGKEVLASVITAEAKDEVVTIGTDKGATAGSAAPAVPAGEAQKIAYDLVKARGWGDDQFSCLVSLWKRESGWRTTAANPSSGAYGIPQALPGSKMAKFGSDWRTNPATQIKWGLSYIKGRYGTPCGAWGSFQSKGWY